jgi:hypothetical protein
MTTRRADFWKITHDFPPPKVRLFAKQPGGGRGQLAISDAELAISSGIPINRVREISFLTSWDSVPVGEMRAFLTACQFDPMSVKHRNRITTYYRICRTKHRKVFQYLRKHPKWESEFLPLVKLLQSMGSQTDSSTLSSQSPLPDQRSVA